jgi:hypothetical protein
MEIERKAQLAFTGFIFLLLLMFFLYAALSGWRFYTALMPMVFSGIGTVLSGFVFIRDVCRYRQERAVAAAPSQPDDDEGVVVMLPTMFIFIGWLLAFYVSVLVVGFLPTIPVAITLYMRFVGGTSWLKSIVTALIVVGLIYLVYEEVIHVAWYVPLVSDLF